MPKKNLSKKRKPTKISKKKDLFVKQSQIVKINLAQPEDKKYIHMMPSFNFPQPILQQQQPSGFNLKDVSQLINSFLPLAISTKDKEIKPEEIKPVEIKSEEIKPVEEIPLVNKEENILSSLPESINTSVSAYERGPYERYKDITEKYSMGFNVSLNQAYEDIKRMEEEGKTKKDIQKIINKHIKEEDERLRSLKLVETTKDKTKDKTKSKSKKEEFIELQQEPLFVEVVPSKSRKKK